MSSTGRLSTIQCRRRPQREGNLSEMTPISGSVPRSQNRAAMNTVPVTASPKPISVAKKGGA